MINVAFRSSPLVQAVPEALQDVRCAVGEVVQGNAFIQSYDFTQHRTEPGQQTVDAVEGDGVFSTNPWRALEHASMPMRQAGIDAISSSSLARATLGRTSTAFACGVHAMHGEDVLGEIDADGDNGHGLPLSTQTSELMRFRTSHRGTWMPIAATARRTRDGEVPFIRWAYRRGEVSGSI